jgi:hypothetical protein
MEYQIARLAYQYKKLPILKTGFTAEFGGNVEFELYSFFEVCHQLKDWIKHDSRYQERKAVEEFITNSKALAICADICNTAKHRKLERPTRSGAELGIFEFSNTISAGLGPATSAITNATITTVRGKESAYKLADECVAEWSKFFSARPGLGVDFSGNLGLLPR